MRVEMFGAETTAGEVDDDRLDFDLRHALGRMNRLADRAFGCFQIDDHAALQPSRTLMSDAEDPRHMGAAAQGFDLVDRLQFRNDADDLAGADIEDRQDGALARGERFQARCQTLT